MRDKWISFVCAAIIPAMVAWQHKKDGTAVCTGSCGACSGACWGAVVIMLFAISTAAYRKLLCPKGAYKC